MTHRYLRRQWDHSWLTRVFVMCATAIVVIMMTVGASSVSATASSPYLNGVRPVTSTAGFTHPGVYVDLPTLESVRQKIAKGEEPQASVFEFAKQHSAVTANMNWDIFSDANNTALPCNPETPQGCVMDCSARGFAVSSCQSRTSFLASSAYLNSLLYYYTDDEMYAQNAIRILNGYGQVFKGFSLPDTTGSMIGVLHSGWLTQTLVRAAEIIRYTYTPSAGSTAFDVAAFAAMLEDHIVPKLRVSTLHELYGRGLPQSNWRSSAIEALTNAAVFLDDRALFNEAVGMWRDFTPAYIYTASDGATSNPFPQNPGSTNTDVGKECYWIRHYSANCRAQPMSYPEPRLVWQNGQSVEICRDMWHAAAGVAGLINTAETARIQQTDLYGEQQTRLMGGVSYMLQIMQSFPTSGYPANFCANAASFGQPGLGGETFPSEPETPVPLSNVIAYNQYATRQGVNFPTLAIPGYSDTYPGGDPVAAYIASNQNGSSDTSGLVSSWTILTHSGVGNGVQMDDGGAPTPPVDPTNPSDPGNTAPGAPNTGTQATGAASPLMLLLLGIVLSTTVWLLKRKATNK